MKIIYLFLLVNFSALANISTDSVKGNIQNAEAIVKTEDPVAAVAVKKTKSNSISGLKIVTCDSQKSGKHIYIISDMYVRKKVHFYNATGEKVYSISTVGSPIYLSKMEKGTYKIKVTEGNKTETKDFVIN
ncbi:T9SS type A sorting domain-containing protein [Flavobacterium humi]|uniref:T9SS type A sorting domain-containing protein n=1 Tax=Flavobacterium humi TaxID=2562683 RepID=A0A4Z0L7N9_9FLAO|nr:T9SS type A sorting domain-containing protein [Flavobacterium humi]TGD58434.1 T9SS type A sorting domain-containing protein [Flavobacterium humi]